MTLTSPRKALHLRMWALFMFFFIPGLLMASWATRTPAIRDTLSVSTAEMGIVLFGLSIGSMSGILCSAWLVKRFGTRAVIRTTMCCAVVGMLGLSVALWFASPLMFALGLMVFGGSFGAAEVAINVEGAAVEQAMNKTVLPMMHGFYSLGTLAGAGIGMALTALGIAANVHILLAALVCIIPILTGIRAIPAGTGQNASDEQKSAAKGLPFYRDFQLMLIGVVVLAMAFAEGSANDWLPLLMVDGHGFSPTSGSLIYAGFTLGMTVGRFTGGWFIDRYSRVAVVRASALLGGLGIAMIIFVDVDWIAGVSVILWGLGASLGFPLTISAASDTGPDAPTRVSVVATTGYLAFLVGPPLLGFLGEHYGLRSAMLVVLGLVIIAALVARAVANRKQKQRQWRRDMSVKLIAVDMDGSFLSDAKTYNRARFLAQYARMKAQGIRFVVASGNQYYQLISFFPEIAHEIAFVAENGGWVVDAGEDVFNGELSKEHFLTVATLLNDVPGIEIIACGKNSAYTLKTYNDLFKEIAAKYYHRLESVSSFDNLNDIFFKFGLNVSDDEIPRIQALLHEKLGDIMVPVTTGHGSIDLIIPGVHKANGLRILQARWGIEDSEVVAFGDSGNDVEMLRQAGYGFAMANARPHIKAVARYEAPNNNDEGVLDVIDRVLDGEAPFN